jgi:choline dehydrogenase-like flavoprotein
VDKGFFGPALRERVYTNTAAQVYFDNSVEVLPDPDNRITVDWEKLDDNGLPRPKIDYKIDKYTLEGVYVSWKRGWEVLEKMGATLDKPNGKPLPKPTRHHFNQYVKKHGVKGGAAMIAGTTRMGTDPKKSVVDPYCRSHDHENLFIVGTGTYVTSGSVSPSLTAAAISLRAAEHIVDTFKNKG